VALVPARRGGETEKGQDAKCKDGEMRRREEWCRGHSPHGGLLRAHIHGVTDPRPHSIDTLQQGAAAEAYSTIRATKPTKLATLVVHCESPTVDDFIDRHKFDVSPRGLFIKTDRNIAPGTFVKFDLRIAGNRSVFVGVGRVVWRRDEAHATAAQPAGIGVKFILVDDPSQVVLDKIVAAWPDAGRRYESQAPMARADVRPRAPPGASRPPLESKTTLIGMGNPPGVLPPPVPPPRRPNDAPALPPPRPRSSALILDSPATLKRAASQAPSPGDAFGPIDPLERTTPPWVMPPRDLFVPASVQASAPWMSAAMLLPAPAVIRSRAAKVRQRTAAALLAVLLVCAAALALTTHPRASVGVATTGEAPLQPSAPTSGPSPAETMASPLAPTTGASAGSEAQPSPEAEPLRPAPTAPPAAQATAPRTPPKAAPRSKARSAGASSAPATKTRPLKPTADDGF